MSRIAAFCDWVLRSPLIWGLLAWKLFDSAVARFGGEWLNSYLTETWIHEVTTAVFFVGMAALVIRGIGVMGQFGSLRSALIDPPVVGGQPVSDAAGLVEQLHSQPSWLQQTYLVTRLKSALDYVQKTQSAEAIEAKLQSLEEADYSRMSSGYSMVRVITGVVPLLGFLGTVIGITAAIAELSPEADKLEASLVGVTDGLSEAFSTTALALTLSIVLVFTKLIVERFEDSLLVQTGRRAYQELVGRFEQLGSATDPNVGSINRMCDQVVRAVEVMAARQADLWKSTIDETNEKWALATSTAGQQLTSSLSEGLRQSLADHASGVTEGVERQIERLNDGLSDQVGTMSEAVTKQSQSVADAVQANVSVLREVVERHATTLDAGANEVLGNLRAGLERMAELLVEALQNHGQTLTAAEKELASENRRHLAEVEAALGEAMVVAADRQEKLINRSEQLLRGMQSSVSESAAATVAHQEQLVKQGEVLLKVVESTGQIGALQETLNKNLGELSRGYNLEETLMSLSAAIQLLSARVGRPAAEPPANKAA